MKGKKKYGTKNLCYKRREHDKGEALDSWCIGDSTILV